MSRQKRRRSSTARTREQFELESEPSFKNHSEVVEWGGVLYWAVDYEAGGAPIGLRLAELRKMEAQTCDRSWTRAKRLLDCVFSEYGKVDVGRVVKVGQGLSHQVFAANVELQNDPDDLSGDYAVLLPIGTDTAAKEDRLASRVTLLQQRAICRHVASQTSKIHVPDLRAIIPLPEGDAIVRPFIRGVPLHLRAGRQPGVRPWEIVAKVAASIHAIDMAAVTELRGFPTRRAHALGELEQLEGLPEFFEAHAWALEHLPPDEPSVLIHGDLLGQNILLGAWDEGRRRRPDTSNAQSEVDNGLAVIDWEYAMLGDPAYDLAIVTRGSKKPFAIDRGLDLLLEVYAKFGKRLIAAHEVHFYELCLVARWDRDALVGHGSGERPESREGHLQGVVARGRRATIPEGVATPQPFRPPGAPARLSWTSTAVAIHKDLLPEADRHSPRDLGGPSPQRDLDRRPAMHRLIGRAHV